MVGIDVYIPHYKYHVKPHSPPCFSSACAAAIVIEITFFICTNRINLVNLKESWARLVNAAKRFLKLQNLYMLIKQKSPLLPRKLDFWWISSVPNKGKSAIPHLFNDLEVLSSAFHKANMFAKNNSKNSNLDYLGILLPTFHSRTNLKLYISVAPKIFLSEFILCKGEQPLQGME